MCPVSQRAFFSHTAATTATAGKERRVGESLLTSSRNTHSLESLYQPGCLADFQFSDNQPFLFTIYSRNSQKKSAAVKSQTLLISFLCSRAQSTLSDWEDLTWRTSELCPNTPLPLSSPCFQKGQIHSAPLKEQDVTLKLFERFHYKEKSFCKRMICSRKEMVICDGVIACVTACWNSSRTVWTDVSGGCVTDVTSWWPKSRKVCSFTLYSGAQIPTIHSSCSPGNSSFLFRSNIAWKHRNEG